jgi:hypothetical protein
MGKVIRLTESDLERIVKQVIEEQETQEGVFDPLVNAYQGLKGVWRGEGYDYFKYLSSLRGITRKLRKLDEPNVKVMGDLYQLRTKVDTSKMPTDKKSNLLNTIDAAMDHFKSYSTLINKIEQLSTQKLA